MIVDSPVPDIRWVRKGERLDQLTIVDGWSGDADPIAQVVHVVECLGGPNDGFVFVNEDPLPEYIVHVEVATQARRVARTTWKENPALREVDPARYVAPIPSARHIYGLAWEFGLLPRYVYLGYWVPRR